MSLEKELAGVTADAIDSPDDSMDDAADDSAEVVAGSEDVEPGDDAVDEDGEKASRSPENVRRELLRKQAESERRIRQEISQIGELVKAALGAAPQSQKPVQTWDDVPLEQMRAYRGQVPEENRAEFDAILTRREIAETVKSQFSAMTEAEKYQREREQANKRAVDNYPQLKDPASPLYAEVNRRLLSTDKNVLKFNTRIVLNLADEVAGEMGIKPRHINKSRIVPQPASVSGKKPTRESTSDSVIPSAERLDQLAKKLLSGSKVKFDEAAKKRIAERGVAYKAAMEGKE